MLPAHLEIVVQEMLLEGLRRTRKGHPLRLVSGPCRDGWRLGLHAEGANVDPSELARIRSGDGASDGMGLGFSVLRSAAELYRGRVSIDCASSIGLSIELLVASSEAR